MNLCVRLFKVCISILLFVCCTADLPDYGVLPDIWCVHPIASLKPEEASLLENTWPQRLWTSVFPSAELEKSVWKEAGGTPALGGHQGGHRGASII